VTRIAQRPWLKWLLRALFAFVACEATLALGALVIEERGVGGGSSQVAAGCILCVGDSHTQGIGATPGHSYPEQLQELLRAAGDPRTVVNLGVAGFDSRKVVDSLEDALAKATPSCVLYLAGNNDLEFSPSLLGLGRAEPARAADDALSWLRTWRMARAAWRMATGDLGHHEIGGAEARRLPPPASVHASKWDEEYARAKASGTVAIAEWLDQFWYAQDPPRMRMAWNDLRAAPDFEQLRGYFRQPLAAYEWELDAFENGRWGEPPGPIADPDENHSFIVVARALAAWSASGDDAALRAEFERPEEVEWARWASPWAAIHLELHRGFAQLLARDWNAAAQTLAAGLARTRSISPRFAWPCFEGGAALAHLFAGADGAAGASSSSPSPSPKYVRDPDEWHVAFWSADQPDGREWMSVAEIAEGARAGLASDASKAARRRAHERFAAPRSRPLRWLFDHPDATFERIRDELPLEPPRTSWWGVRRFLFRNVDADEFRRLAAVQHERLAELARRGPFDVVVLGYLVENYPMFNTALRELAATRGWPLADVGSRLSRAEIEADDHQRYFSGDRAHPNDAGYGLMARAAFEALQRLKSSGAAADSPPRRIGGGNGAPR
jgi:lysophospholipase L1-like esterase